MIAIKELAGAANLDQPRRLMKFVLVYCTAGEVLLNIDGQSFQLTTAQVITITSGQVHSVQLSAAAKGYILEFSLDFFCKDDKDIELIFHNGLFCHFGMNEVITVEPEVMAAQLAAIQQELAEQPYQYIISTRSRIALILVAINRAKVSRGDEIWKPDALFLKFLEAVRSNFEHNYSVSDFAALLHTTELKLNELAKLHAGKTAQNVIYGQIISEAKRLFTYTELSVKEVAYQLGFQDPFYFSNFFKKQTRVAPKQYREGIRL